MKKAVVIILIIMLIALVGCNSTTENEVEQEIINQCCEELGVNDGELYYVSKTEVEWLDYDVYNYIFIANSKAYTVGVQRNEEEIHYVDVMWVI